MEAQTKNTHGAVRFCAFLQIALGTVTNVEEAVKWLSYTYLYVRMRANPLAYGINHRALQVGEIRLTLNTTKLTANITNPFKTIKNCPPESFLLNVVFNYITLCR